MKVIGGRFKMRIDVDFKYGEPVIAAVYYENGLQFMRSEVKVRIPKKPKDDSTEAKMDKWKEKVLDKISQAVIESLPEGLYGTININVKGLDEGE